MAKYDQYKVTSTPQGSFIELNRELSVLFEDGDVTAEVMASADMLLVNEAAGDAVPLSEQLLALPLADFRTLIRNVWIEQMAPMGNNKHAYANQIQDDLNTARNTRN